MHQNIDLAERGFRFCEDPFDLLVRRDITLFDKIDPGLLRQRENALFEHFPGVTQADQPRPHAEVPR